MPTRIVRLLASGAGTHSSLSRLTALRGESSVQRAVPGRYGSVYAIAAADGDGCQGIALGHTGCCSTAISNVARHKALSITVILLLVTNA
jgi:hypothetical protein